MNELRRDAPPFDRSAVAPPPHIPVLAAEVEEALAPVLRPGGRALDATLGAGGHAERLIPRLLPGGLYVGVDRDPAALAIARERLAPFGAAVRFVHGRMSTLHAIARAEVPGGVDALLLDVGVSSMQLDQPARGFSFAAAARGEPLDMRMDPGEPESAADLVRDLPEQDLADVIYRYGEERLSRRIARAIVEARRRSAITTTGALADIVERAVPRSYERGRIHPATRTFQALRIAVNDELGELTRALAAIPAVLRPGGRAAVIAFHSLEDRIVKLRFRALAREGGFALVTKKPLGASDAEVAANRRARSAKLRVIERAAG